LALETRISGEYRFTGGQLQPAKRLAAPRGLNHNHSHDLKNVFKGAAMQASGSSNALGDRPGDHGSPPVTSLKARWVKVNAL